MTQETKTAERLEQQAQPELREQRTDTKVATVSPDEKLQKISDSIRIEILANIKLDERGIPIITNVLEAYEYAKSLAIQGPGVPPHCRMRVGVCYAVVMQAALWRQDPGYVARNSYLSVSQTDTEGTLSYTSQLLHAVVESRAPLQNRLRISYDGEGDDLRCIVKGHFINEQEPHVLTSEVLRKLRPNRNERGGVKGSPLWDKDPKIQMAYYTLRTFARLYCADVLGGVYSVDELEDNRDTRTRLNAPPAPSGLLERLKTVGGDANAPGFSGTGVDKVIDGMADEKPARSRKRKAAETPAAAEIHAAAGDDETQG